MLTQSDEKLPVYQVIGSKLRIHWGYKKIPATEERPEGWACEEACVAKTADRDTIISAIIRSRYTIDAEFAAINNGGDDHKALQDFRTEAKALADGWGAS